MKRKIAAILAADISGYSRLVGEDEEDTLRRLASYRAVFSDFIERFGGRIFNTAGDAILAEFASAVDAVRCAVDTQESLRTRNLAYPASRQMNFRIGITIGDVVEREGDLLGEGVNIASRLESIAPAGGICISRSVHEAVANKISLKFADAGEHQLKNLPDPVHAFMVSLEPFEKRAWAPAVKAVIRPIKGAAATIALLVGLAAGAYVIGHYKRESADVAAVMQTPARTGDATSGPPADVEAAETAPVAALPTAEETPPTDAPAETSEAENEPADFAKALGIGDQLAGDWSGTLTENDGDQYRVEIALPRDGGKGKIAYPKLKCVGTLEYLERRDQKFVFKEKITKGTVCGNTAEVELTVSSADGSTVDYNWIGPGPKVKGRLTGTLIADVKPDGEASGDCTKYLPNRGIAIRVPCE